MARQQFNRQVQIKAINSKKINFIRADEEYDNVNLLEPGQISKIYIYPEDGTVALLDEIRIAIFNAYPSATSGTHRAYLGFATSNLSKLKGVANYNSDLDYNFGEWATASIEQGPKDIVNQRDVKTNFDVENPLMIEYRNDTDVNCNGKLMIFLKYLEEKVS